jgi:hypothetical protein
MMLLRRKGPGVAIQDSARVRPFPVREGTVILRGAIVFLGLMLLLCAAARAEKRVAQEVLVFPAAPTVGQSFVTFEPVGSWASRDWGEVVLNADGTGTYTDTFGTGPGRIELAPTCDRSYKGSWGESNQRSGTLVIILSPDGRTITGIWTPDASSTIGSKTGGTILWTRK